MNKQEKALIYFKSRKAMMLTDQVQAYEDEAISALEKQIPKPAEYHHKADGECALTICPNCENRLTVTRYVFPLNRHCKECGQHYVVEVEDWSVEE